MWDTLGNGGVKYLKLELSHEAWPGLAGQTAKNWASVGSGQGSMRTRGRTPLNPAEVFLNTGKIERTLKKGQGRGGTCNTQEKSRLLKPLLP